MKLWGCVLAFWEWGVSIWLEYNSKLYSGSLSETGVDCRSALPFWSQYFRRNPWCSSSCRYLYPSSPHITWLKQKCCLASYLIQQYLKMCCQLDHQPNISSSFFWKVPDAISMLWSCRFHQPFCALQGQTFREVSKIWQI